MPLYHCSECHHEWEDSSPEKSVGKACDYCKNDPCTCPPWTVYCDWCGAEGYILAEKTDFERFMESLTTRKQLIRKARKYESADMA